MLREEAEKLVGERVAVWTAMNGSYTGILTRVLECKPWRGIVGIDGVTQCWCLYEIGRNNQRRGLTLGREYEFGHSSIAPTMVLGMSKREALECEITKCVQWLRDPVSQKYHPDIPRHIIDEARKQLEEMYR